ncbi:hypothetical protein [Sphingomonas morindae]|uniref:Secreted protein n=1 Tax=Sphingomonas morindae TaxID=1541170 RepID=A0ABY4X8J4_9SPHN|nr:hypothetical protein [Sphingomonas morindae]USI72996.1 hypothetical protein LHA26_00515 [Sphingomonas morindae]
MGKALLIILPGSLIVLLSRDLAIKRRKFCGCRMGFELRGGDDDGDDHPLRRSGAVGDRRNAPRHSSGADTPPLTGRRFRITKA